MTDATPQTPPDAPATTPGDAPAPVPLSGGAFQPLSLPPPPGKFRGQGSVAVFQGRIVVAAADRVVSALPEDRGWKTLFEPEKQPLTDGAAALAEKLKMVKDGPAAKMKGVKQPGLFGIGPFVTFQGSSDKAPALYCPTRSIFGGQILRSGDGETMEECAPPGLGDASRAALGALAACDGWLVTALSPIMQDTARSGPMDPTGDVRVFASRDPASGRWDDAAEPGFGQGAKGAVTALACAFGRVFAAVMNPDQGFELWQATPGRALPWVWEKVLERGGHGYSLAPMVSQMVEFGGALYVAAGISESGFGKDYAGPGAAELLRLHPDGRWDVIVGHPRFSPDGLKVPLSGMGPGFGSGHHTLILSLAAHDGVLYAGTRNIESEFRIHRAKKAAKDAPEDAPPPKMAGGAGLWASVDGETWDAVITDGNGNPAMTAIRSLFSAQDRIFAAMSMNPQVLAHDLGMGDIAKSAAADELEIWRAG